ncbi:hypothetical protein SAMN02745229_04142, partial [Butyrivibrio fibrisolvens DSM 3071]
SGEITADEELVLKLYYTRDKNLKYVVHYYLEGTTISLADDKTVDDAVFGKVYEETAEEIEDYELVSESPQTVSFEQSADDQEIFFYYKLVPVTLLVDLIADDESDTVMYDAEEHTIIDTFTLTPQDESVTVEKADAGFTIKVGKQVFTLTGLTLSGGTGTDVNTYPVAIDGTYSVVIANGEEEADMTGSFTVILPEDAALTITPAYVTLTSGSATKVADGTALTEPSVSMDGTFYERDGVLTWDVTGSQTEVGSSDNVFTIAINGDTIIVEEEEPEQQEPIVPAPADESDETASIYTGTRHAKNDGDYDQVIEYGNYVFRLVYGTLTVTPPGGPTPPPTPPPVPPTPPTTIVPTTTPAAAAPVATPAVLGATREVEELVPEEPAVLGESRTRQTGDESQIPVRVLLIMICAGAIITIMMTNRKKEEQ